MKKKTLKIIAIIMLAILLIVIMSMSAQTLGVTAEEEDKTLGELFGNGALFVVDGIVGILLSPLKLFIIIIGSVVRAISGGIALIGGTNGLSNTIDTIILSPEDIIFNQVKLTDINIFDLSVTGAMLTIRQNIAMWYYALRNLAVVILLIILVYVGIRMALSTVAEEEAKYKKMLIDWLVSLALVFLLHYIIIFTIWVSNGLVEILSNSIQPSTGFGDAINKVLARSLDFRLTVGLGSAIVYGLLCMLSLIFLILYIKRMLTVSFLILIAPIITITYSINKMGDGKSQAVNTWLKEFVYNVLVQPVHCLIYLVFGTTAVNLMNGSLSSSVLAIIMLGFILQGEKIVKHIFGFKASSLGEAAQSAVAVGVGMQVIAKGISDGAKAAGAVANAAGGTSGKPGNINDSASSYAAAMGAGASAGPSGGSGSGTSGSSGGSSPYTPSSPGKLAQVGGLLGNKAAGLAKAGAKKIHPARQFEWAMAMFGAAPGFLQDNPSTMVAGGSVGHAVGKKWVQDHDAKKMQKQINQNEQQFASVYQDYARDTGMNVDDLKAKSEELLDMDIKDIKTPDIKYASYLYSLQDTYAAAGEKDVRKKILETIDNINNGNIQPKAPKS